MVVTFSETYAFSSRENKEKNVWAFKDDQKNCFSHTSPVVLSEHLPQKCYFLTGFNSLK